MSEDYLDFEEPIFALEKKILDLQSSPTLAVDPEKLTNEISKLNNSIIKLTKKISSNDLLRLLLSNSIEILEFKQKTPNMNDIFIMKVEEGNNNG